MSDVFARAVRELEDASGPLLQRALRRGGDVADLFAENTGVERLSLRRERGRTSEQLRRLDVAGTGVRVISGISSHLRSAESLKPAEIERLADVVAEEAGASIRSAIFAGDQSGIADELRPPVAGPISPRENLPPIPDAPDAATLDEKRALVQAALDAAFSLEPGIERLNVDFQGRVRRVLVAATDMRPVMMASSRVGLRVAAEITRGGRRFSAYAVGGGPGGLGTFFNRSPESIARECIERLHVLTESRPAAQGEMPVVIAGGWGGAWLHEAVGHLLEADVAGSGPYRPIHIGRRVAAANVTVIDDPSILDVHGSRFIDDEGAAACRTVLIDGGVLVALITDRLRARILGLPRSANGLRQDFRLEPLPRMTNLFLEKGDADADDLVASIRSGLFVRMIANGRVNPADDQFSFDVLEGYRIENGRPGRPVSGARVHGRPSDVLQRIEGIANDLQFDHGRGICQKHGQAIAVSVGMPTVLISRLTVERITE